MAYNIGGALPFGGGGAGALSGNPASAYASAYNSALQMNSQNYSNILSGYQQLGGNQQSTQQGIIQGYGQLTGDVMGLIAGTNQAAQQQINDQYAAQQGSANQDLINRGLGNTTVQSSIDRGLQFDRSKSQVNLANQFAQMNAQYRTQLGLAGLDYQNQANMQNTALGSQQLGWMNSVNAQYPNASQYAQLAQMKGANKAGSGMGVPAMGGGGISSDGGMKNPFSNLGGGSGSYSQIASYGAPNTRPNYGTGTPSPSEIYPSQNVFDQTDERSYQNPGAYDPYSNSAADQGSLFGGGSVDYGGGDGYEGSGSEY